VGTDVFVGRTFLSDMASCRHNELRLAGRTTLWRSSVYLRVLGGDGFLFKPNPNP